MNFVTSGNIITEHSGSYATCNDKSYKAFSINESHYEMNIKKTSDMVQYEEIDDDDSEAPSSFP